MSTDAKSLFSQLFEDPLPLPQQQSVEPPRGQARTRPSLQPPQAEKPRPPPTNGATKPLAEPAKPVSRSAAPTTPTKTPVPQQPPKTTQPVGLSGKKPRTDAPLIDARTFVQLEASESDDEEVDSLSDDDEEALAAAADEDYDSDEYGDDDEDDFDELDDVPAPRSRRATKPAATKPDEKLAKREAELQKRESEAKAREDECGRRTAELAIKDSRLEKRESACVTKERELTELHRLVQQHHRSMMEQQQINKAVSDALDTRLKVLEEQEAKALQQATQPQQQPAQAQPPPLQLPLRTQFTLERAQAEQMLPRAVVDELNYVALSQSRIFDLLAYRTPSDQVGRDVISLDVIERGTGRFVFGQTRWPF